MVGKRRLRLDEKTLLNQPDGDIVDERCPLCNRIMPTGPTTDEHHLIPKSKGGVDKFRLHKICHQKIHATLSENELAKHYHTWRALKNHPEIAKFIAWVQKRPPDYIDKNRRIKR